jgi:predicted nucleic acid-binding Zn ribbon protein
LERIGRILDSVVESLGLKKKLDEGKAILIWEKAVGEKIANHTRPLRVEGSKLFVEVSGSSWRNELTFLKPEIIQKLNSAAGSEVVDDIIFVAGAGFDNKIRRKT